MNAGTLRTIFTDPAHLLSVVRVPMAALVWWNPSDPRFVVGMLIAAGLTDLLDGWLGRSRHAGLTGTANIGAWLDPVCDKIFLTSAAAAVAFAFDVPLFVIGLLLVRDVATLVLTVVFRVVAGAARFHGHDFRANKPGKLTTALQGMTLVAVMFWPDATLPFAIASAVMGTVSVVMRGQIEIRAMLRR